ncbi:hypothetical protein BDFB_002973 [Asbolus verrucosus]|uniref:Uncharacterized protein n=1 Tax=Asbolus verrucosus TaxID=1661398 RepID=A0A482W7K0_ASBVE|nr:hypothetical protein BDFB_002973 [Asbolus verrucosus]
MSELPLSMVPWPGLAEVPVLGDSYQRPTAADSFVISIIMSYNSFRTTLSHAKNTAEKNERKKTEVDISSIDRISSLTVS